MKPLVSAKKIVFITEYYPPHIGGLERFFKNLAEGLAKAGHRPVVITSRQAGTKKEEFVNGVEIKRVSVPRLGDRYWFTIAAILKTIRDSKDADIIHTTTYNGAFPAWICARLLSKPVVITVHEVVGDNWRGTGLNPLAAGLLAVLEKMVLKLPFDRFICNSSSTLSSLRKAGVRGDNALFIYHGIDNALFDAKRRVPADDRIRALLGIGKGAFLYIFFGRPGYVKGVEFLIRAVPLIKEMVPDSTALLILSKKPERGRRRAESLISDLKLERGKDIIVLDPVSEDELPYYIGSSDCVVVPSISEGFGFTCAEACAMERPVVASNTTSIPEVVSGSFVLVEPAKPSAIAEGVAKVFRKDFVVTDKKIFLWADTVRRHIEVYAELLGEKDLKHGQ
ncbi:MAG: glycosyltransferase family 4 protein [Deltaproteobacteria bacterium]|nr:glycosyltransferase family 4 protein [Deltaproteobacteria bacterium]